MDDRKEKRGTVLLLVPRIEAFALPILVERSNAKVHAEYAYTTPYA